MKKSLLLASLLLIGSTNIMAAKVGEVGVGLEYGVLNSDAVSRTNGVSADGDLDTTFQALRIGKYYDYGRLGASIGTVNKDAGTDGQFIGVSYDYMFYNDGKIIPFVGLTAAYSWNEWEGSGISIDHDGLQYGVEAGIVYELSGTIDLELGGRYLESNVDGTKTVGATTIELDVDSAVQYYISIGYKF